MVSGITGAFVIAALAASMMLASTSSCRAMDLPFQPTLDANTLGTEWTRVVSEGNNLKVQDGWVSIDAGKESFGHIQRPLVTDNVTITAKIAVCGSMYVAWDADNWCGVGKFTPSPFGKFYSTVTENGKTVETDHRGCSFWAPHLIRLQIGQDCIRLSYSNDGSKWYWLRTIERPASYKGAPAILAFGKHYPPGMKPFAADVVAGSAKGDRFGLSVTDIRIEATPTKSLRMTAGERKELSNTISDRVAHAILSKPEDPTYASVSKYFPAMKFPREIVGVPEHPLDIGVDYCGRLDVGPWGPPVAWFEIDDKHTQFDGSVVMNCGDGWWRMDVSKPEYFDKAPMTRRLLDGYLPVITLTRKQDDVKYEMTVYGWSEGFSPDKDLHAFVRIKASGAKLPKQVSLVYDAGNQCKALDLDSSGQVCVMFKYPEPATLKELSPKDFEGKLSEVADFWRRKIKPAEQFDIPDKRVSEAYKAWFTYAFLNADKINGFTEIHDGAGFYEEIFGHSMALHVMAMDMYGLHDYAERLLDTMLHFQQPNGNYQQACGLADHGALLMAMSWHYEMTHDDAWLKRVTPQMVKACDWLVEQLANAPKDGVTKGLIKFRPYNDYATPVFNYMGNVVCARGLEMAAGVLRSDKYTAAAARYRKDILASMEKAAFEHEGMTILDVEPDTNRLLKLGKYQGGDHYGLVVSMLLENDFLGPYDKRTFWYTDILEKREGLVAGVSEFMEGIDHAYTYGYLMTQMKRDDIRKVLLGFWSMLAYGMTRDTYSPVEVSVILTGENHLTLPHSYSLTQQFRLLRNMLIWEDGDILRIGNAIPREWLQPGKRVAANEAPTLFGPVTFSITSNADGTMRVHLVPPTRNAPAKIMVRLRHPKNKEIAGVTGAEAQFRGDTLALHKASKPVDLVVRFK